MRTLFSCLIFLLLFPPGLVAQDALGSAPAASQGVVYGAGIQTPLRFEGEAGPKNQMSLGVGASLLYDDNVYSINTERVGEEALSFDANLGFTRRSEHWTASFDYAPFFIWYSALNGFDQLNHSGSLNLAYRLTSRVTLGVNESATYRNGSYAALVAQPIPAGPSTSPFQNDVIIPYTTRTLSNWSGLTLSFVTSRRTTISLSGDYNQYKYRQQLSAQPFYDNTGLTGGLAFDYQWSRHTRIGFGLYHSDTSFQGGLAFGNRLRLQMETASASLTFLATPSVQVSAFGGPQYVRSINQGSPLASLAANFEASGGANITKQVRSTAVDFSVARFVGYGGGLYATAVNTTASFGVRQRLGKGWEADASGGVIQLDASLFKYANAKTDGVNGGISITHPVLRRAVFHVSYFRWNQVSHGSLPLSYNLDRDQVAMGIDLQVKSFSFGR
jgi:hypothetical protein